MTEKRMLYKERDLLQFPTHYTDHLGAMTAESLHDKSDIAGQLAWRDWLLSNVIIVMGRIHGTCTNSKDPNPEVVKALERVGDDIADNLLDELAKRYPELMVERREVGRWKASTPNILNIPRTTGRLSSSAPNLSNTRKTAGGREVCPECKGAKTAWGGSFYTHCLNCFGTGEVPPDLSPKPAFDTTPPECVPKGARWAQWIVDAGAGTIIATLWVDGDRVVSNMMKPWPAETSDSLSPSYAAFCAALYHGHVGRVG